MYEWEQLNNSELVQWSQGSTKSQYSEGRRQLGLHMIFLQILSVYNFKRDLMAGRGPGDSFMFRQGANRFQPFGMSHNSMMGNSMMSQHMMNSSLYENIHNLKTDMPSDVLELFKANEVSKAASIDRIRQTHAQVQVPLS